MSFWACACECTRECTCVLAFTCLWTHIRTCKCPCTPLLLCLKVLRDGCTLYAKHFSALFSYLFLLKKSAQVSFPFQHFQALFGSFFVNLKSAQHSFQFRWQTLGFCFRCDQSALSAVGGRTCHHAALPPEGSGTVGDGERG